MCLLALWEVTNALETGSVAVEDRSAVLHDYCIPDSLLNVILFGPKMLTLLSTMMSNCCWGQEGWCGTVNKTSVNALSPPNLVLLLVIVKTGCINAY